MEIVKNKNFWINGILYFIFIILIDWFGGRGRKLFQGATFSQVTEGYRIKLAWLVIGLAVSGWGIYKEGRRPKS